MDANEGVCESLQQQMTTLQGGNVEQSKRMCSIEAAMGTSGEALRSRLDLLANSCGVIKGDLVQLKGGEDLIQTRLVDIEEGMDSMGIAIGNLREQKGGGMAGPR